MGLPIKHYASLVGLILVGALAMFFCFLPDLIKENHLTLREGTWIALFVTLGSFGCFWIEKQEAAKEERERERREAEREKRQAERDEEMIKLINGYRRMARPDLPSQNIFGGFSDPLGIAQILYEEIAWKKGDATKIAQIEEHFRFAPWREAFDAAIMDLREKTPDSPLAKIDWRKMKTFQDVRNVAEVLTKYGINLHEARVEAELKAAKAAKS